MKILSLVLYFFTLCLVYHLVTFSPVQEEWSKYLVVECFRSFIASVYAVVRLGVVLVWVSAFPAWFIATRISTFWIRALMLLVGILVFMSPVFSRYARFYSDPSQEFWRSVAIVAAVICSASIAAIYQPLPVQSRRST
jgi:hypothetical protein